MARTNSFKTYERGVRQQYTEETFTSGMQYTNSPLSEGYNKVILNFDLTDDGRTLTPRNGFKFDYASNYKSTAASSYVTNIETAVIVDAKRCFELFMNNSGLLLDASFECAARKITPIRHPEGNW